MATPPPMAAFICSGPRRARKSLSVKVITPSQAVEMIIGNAMASNSATPPFLTVRLSVFVLNIGCFCVNALTTGIRAG